MHPCPKCSYVRQASDTNPDWQCPSCGVAYSKVKAAATAPAEPAPRRRSSANVESSVLASFLTPKGILFSTLVLLILIAVFINGKSWSWRSKMTRPGFVHGVHITEPVIQTFDVSGATPQELDQSMLANGPLNKLYPTRRWGMCLWNIQWDIAHAFDGRECRIDKFSIKLHGVIHLPRYVNRSSASEEMKTKWDSFAAALKTHEYGHWENGIVAAHELEKRLSAIPPNKNCESLNQEITMVGEQLFEEYREIDKEYDRRTQHGVHQGARLW